MIPLSNDNSCLWLGTLAIFDQWASVVEAYQGHCVVYVFTHVFKFPVNTILAWIINIYHWCRDVLYKRFLPPFCDGVLNYRLVSDRGAFPHDPETVGIGPPATEAGAKWARVRSGEASKPNRFRSYVHPTGWIPEKHFRSYVYHTQFLCGNVCARWPNTNSSLLEAVCDC